MGKNKEYQGSMEDDSPGGDYYPSPTGEGGKMLAKRMKLLAAIAEEAKKIRSSSDRWGVIYRVSTPELRPLFDALNALEEIK